MPYIAPSLQATLKPNPESTAATVGELTYQIQQLFKVWIDERGDSYQNIGECLLAVEGAKADLIDRKLLPYERLKREQNGDVW